MKNVIAECAKLFEDNRWDQALGKLNRYIMEHPLDRAAHEGLLKVYSLKGNLSCVEEELMRYMVALAGNGQAAAAREVMQELIALARDKEGTLKKLVSILKMTRMNEEFYYVMLMLAALYLEHRKKKQAAALLSKLNEALPGDFETRLKIALLNGRAGDPVGALILLKGCLNDALRQHMEDRAEKVMRAMKEVSSDDATILFALAEAYENLDDIDSAAEQYTKILKVDRGNYQALLAIGKNLFATERYELAIRTFTRIIKIIPDENDALRGLAGSLQKTGRMAEAVETYLKLARACLREKKNREASRAFQMVLDIQQDNRVAKRGLERIREGSLFSRKGSAEAAEPSAGYVKGGGPAGPGKKILAGTKKLPEKVIKRAVKPVATPETKNLTEEMKRFLESSIVYLRTYDKNVTLALATWEGALLWSSEPDKGFHYSPAQLIRIGKIFSNYALVKNDSLKLCMLEFEDRFYYFAFLKREAYALMIVPPHADYGGFISWLTYIHERLLKLF